MVAGDNDHFRRQLVVLEVVRAGQAVAGAVAAHIDHLVSGPRLTFLPLCLIRLAKPDPATLPYQAQETFTALPVQDRTGG